MSQLNKIKKKIFEAYLSIIGFDRLDLVLILTLLLLLSYPPGRWYSDSIIVILSIVGILFSQVRKNAVFWLLITLILFFIVLRSWFVIDNHKFLELYWCFALFIAISSKIQERSKILFFNAKMLIGLSMLFATLWKLLSITYLDGTFFEYTLLLDDRFQHVTGMFGGLTDSQITKNLASIDLLKNGYLFGIGNNEFQIFSSNNTQIIAQFITWWTIVIEASIAVLFLMPTNSFTEISRNVLLLIFIVTTYCIFSLVSFGWLLVILGISQCTSKRPYFIILYFVALILLFLYEIPFSNVTSNVEELINYIM